jgi:hypothetical protein
MNDNVALRILYIHVAAIRWVGRPSVMRIIASHRTYKA